VAGALAGGAALPRETSATPLGPGESAHARFARVGIAGYFGEDEEYRPSFFLTTTYAAAAAKAGTSRRGRTSGPRRNTNGANTP